MPLKISWSTFSREAGGGGGGGGKRCGIFITLREREYHFNHTEVYVRKTTPLQGWPGVRGVGELNPLVEVTVNTKEERPLFQIRLRVRPLESAQLL
jgi:hypothetical protein